MVKLVLGHLSPNTAQSNINPSSVIGFVLQERDSEKNVNNAPSKVLSP